MFTPSACQQRALDALHGSVDNVFLTGPAGTGKSRVIREFLSRYDRKSFPVVASTGVAAVLVGGRTFHSFFGLGILEGGVAKTVTRALDDRRVKSRLRNIQGIVLDEVSMIPGEALCAAEEISRRARQKKMPWGGLRVIAVGDFAQLPPVTQGGASKDWSFLTETWAKSDFRGIFLKTPQRARDEEFLEILMEVRHGRVTERVKNFLNRRVDETVEPGQRTFLFPLRHQVERFNESRLALLEESPAEFPTEYSGNSRFVEILKKNAPVPEVLRLKRDALVMIRVNDPEQRYVNGTTGFIEEMTPMHLFVRLKSGRVIDLEPHSFVMLDAEGNEVAAAKNFPVSLAYAMTIHKAQGATLDDMVADLRSLWEPGQAYVALSRLRSADTLTLTGWDASSIRADPQVAEFYATID